MRLTYGKIFLTVDKIPVAESGRSFIVPLDRHFSVWICNTSEHDLEYEIEIDRRPAGRWRVARYGQLKIERPADKALRFFFMDRERLPQLGHPGPHGELKVKEYICGPEPDWEVDSGVNTVEVDSGGVTVLMGASAQTFSRCAPRDTEKVADYTMTMKSAGASRAASMPHVWQ